MLKYTKYASLCPLCGGEKYFFKRYNRRSYYKCEKCKGVSLDKNYYPTPEEEKKRYLEHNNDVHDIRYQNFVSPIVSAIRNDFTKQHKGLDYGAGTGPVITKLLTDYSYDIKPYDPYFYNYPDYLKQKYDYIACCEVIKHFYNPYNEFRKLKRMLNKDGKLYCKTELLKENITFENWYYKNDLTHVFFYTEKSLQWVKENFSFSNIIIKHKDRLIIFWN